MPRTAIQNAKFLEQWNTSEESLYLGGPCGLSRDKDDGDCLAPLTFREVALKPVEGDPDILEIQPVESNWSFTPKLLENMRWENVAGEFGTKDPRSLLNDILEHLAESGDHADTDIGRELWNAVGENHPQFLRQGAGQQPASHENHPNWILFQIGPGHNPYTQHLMRDYEELQGKTFPAPSSPAEKRRNKLGGLWGFETPDPVPAKKEGVAELFVPLNSLQKTAVEGALEGNPLSVISGPPGTGKSQVVVSLLMNAWAQGKSILFASTNNEAVNVVVGRIRDLVPDFPLVVRLGSRDYREKYIKTLKDLQHHASKVKRAKEADLIEERDEIAQKKSRLTEDRKRLKDFQGGELYDRIEEKVGAAIEANREARECSAKIQEREAEFQQQATDLGIPGLDTHDLQESLEENREWIDRLADCRTAIEENQSLRDRLQAEFREQEDLRDEYLEKIAPEQSAPAGRKRIGTTETRDAFDRWIEEFVSYGKEPLEEILDGPDWSPEFDFWSSSADVAEWAQAAKEISQKIRNRQENLPAAINRLEECKKSLQRELERLVGLGIPEQQVDEIDHEMCREWKACFLDFENSRGTLGNRLTGLIPRTKSNLYRTRLRQADQRLRENLPLSATRGFHGKHGQRINILQPIVDGISAHAAAKRSYGEAKESCALIDNSSAITKESRELRLPENNSLEAIQTEIDKRLANAAEAVAAWKKKERAKSFTRTVQAHLRQWHELQQDPLLAAWYDGIGRSFQKRIQSLLSNVDPAELRQAIGTAARGKLADLIDNRHRASRAELQAREHKAELEQLPSRQSIVQQWWAHDAPKIRLLWQTKAPKEPPEPDEADLTSFHLFDSTRSEFEKEERPRLSKQEALARDRTNNQLRDLLRLLPAQQHETRLCEDFIEPLLLDDARDWDGPGLREKMSAFSPARLQTQIDGIEKQLEAHSIKSAQIDWKLRLKKDTKPLKGLDDCLQFIQRTERPPPKKFRQALEVAPVWVTTSLSTQVIPLDAGLFDMVVIDEASQCTLTQVLPLFYRGCSVVTLGDVHQLGPITNLPEGRQKDLARQKKLEEKHLDDLGHDNLDSYRASKRALPDQDVGVLQLLEHFRSHPLIIGFSNRFIYNDELELRRKPDPAETGPQRSGVFRVNVEGRSVKSNRSWSNDIEANHVVKEIANVIEQNPRTFTIGVVTPYKRQKELIENKIKASGIRGEIKVGTADTFQGSERDIMFISPVISAGFKGSMEFAGKTERINVAVTRAREALFVVADFDECRKDNGSLGDLIRYVDDIEIIREQKSPAELLLFEWLICRGYKPKPQKRIADIRVDFVLESESGTRLAIEVDGKQHADEQALDQRRDDILAREGYAVLRVEAKDVFETPLNVVERIRDALDDKHPQLTSPVIGNNAGTAFDHDLYSQDFGPGLEALANQPNFHVEPGEDLLDQSGQIVCQSEARVCFGDRVLQLIDARRMSPEERRKLDKKDRYFLESINPSEWEKIAEQLSGSGRLLPT